MVLLVHLFKNANLAIILYGNDTTKKKIRC